MEDIDFINYSHMEFLWLYRKTIYLWCILGLGLSQTSSFARDEPNSNLGRPELSKDRLLGQTSNLGRIKPISINILWKEKVQVKP